MITLAAPMPADVAERIRRRDAAIQWRIDHLQDPNRDDAWVMFRAFAVWRTLAAEDRRPIILALNDAERTVRFDP